MKELFRFLTELDQNNNREWFNANKDWYLRSKETYESFVGEIINGLSSFDPEIAGVQVKDSVFRIYRDVRFSTDKSPYKTHMGAFIARGGKMSARGGYYVHIEPGGSLFAGGIWCPDAALLKALRQDIFANVDEFTALLNDPEFSHHFSMDGEKLKKVPAPFPKDEPGSEWVKYKSYTPVNMVPDEFYFKGDPVKKSLERLKLLLPFNKFLNFTVDETGRR
ncbi:MAG TPA: DUF2461 domain-containing protein [Bacteroidales bacterium]|nr:DUF2461 domain-containing protein [Bacteroidales bacterium]HPT11360.1 DUF2461 domain-containing protein [Bacteroidales bacterium]